MKSKRSRLALVGMLALALTVTVGLAAGSAEAAKKKKKKKAPASITLSVTTPTTVPPKASNDANDTMVAIPLTVGNKAKGKVVGWDAPTVTTTFSSPDSPGLGDGYALLTAPNGRTEFLFGPVSSAFVNNTTSGPLTETANSPFQLCFPNATHVCPGGSGEFPDATVGPPYQGTVQNEQLEGFAGIGAKGTWTLKVLTDSITQPITLQSASITIPLKANPPA
jgi:hypothetical protein